MLSADTWMDRLGINLWDETSRARIEAMQWDLGKKLLALGVLVIVEWGTWGRSERDKLRMEAREIGAGVELHYLTAPFDVLYSRVKLRGREDPPIERDALLRYREALQAPTPDELQLFDVGLHIETDETPA